VTHVDTAQLKDIKYDNWNRNRYNRNIKDQKKHR
jgi:hypothetical protein